MLRGRTQVELYESEGFSHEDAVTVIELLSKHPKKFIDVMMVDELGLMPPSTPAPRHVVPLAVSTLLGTAVGGLLSAESALRMSTPGHPLGGSSAGLFAVLVSVAAILGGACEVLVRFKGASARRVATSGCFFVVCLGVAAAAAFCLAHWLAG